jgi:hypothetical protein
MDRFTRTDRWLALFAILINPIAGLIVVRFLMGGR